MKFMNRSLSTLGAAVTLVAMGLPVVAGNVTASNPLSGAIAQTEIAPAASSLIGQCRAVNKATPIFQDRSTTSTVVRSLKMDERVTLAENAATGGLIAVSAPARGFVQTATLKLCAGGTPTPKPTPTTPPSPTPKPSPTTPPVSDAKKLCRQVARTPLLIENGGLNIRSEPNTTAASVGGVAPGATLTLTTAPATTKDDSAGRVWVQISGPQAGWVSNGFRGGLSNMVMCP
jgi:hypothetical protein